jgi:N utilization substance protein A
MAIALGTGEVKTVEDLADLVPDDLRGWFEAKDGARVRQPGLLESFNLSPEDAEALIMRARVVMGWVEAPEVVEDEAELELEADLEPEADAEA